MREREGGDNDGWQLIGETRIFFPCSEMEFSRIKKTSAEAAAPTNFSSSAKNFFPQMAGRMFVLRKINSALQRGGVQEVTGYTPTFAIFSNQESNTSIPSTSLTDLDMNCYISIHMSKMSHSNDMQCNLWLRKSKAVHPLHLPCREGPIQSSFSRTKEGRRF